MSEVASVLVVANQTAESDELLAALRTRADEGPVEYTLLVPATPHGVRWAVDMFAGAPEAERHLSATVERLERAGLPVKDAKVGDPDPLAAVQDEVNFGRYDEIVVSTLPQHLSRWLRVDLPHKVRHATGLPVQHVAAQRARAHAR